MRTLDLRQNPMSLEELLQVASNETVLILSDDGNEYILEAADAFEQEVAELAKSQRFMAFLAERSKEAGKTSLDEIERRLAQAE
ncbi:MAG: hypothetical protein F6J86_37040 [Symploca sp. SIO1B1]|nr:hypothetical protein [Symploca sp. SIO2D2]NER21481.1 hypothetical protein [Symploca sp. SIO1C2]NER99366.1 hypothetical protein [Symploca sp. SIO1B1]